jgi:4-amino-4-deoxy-L-arabinose transferase-like glycosyltransferase
VSFAREGLPLIVIAALVAAGTYALALNRRSWPLWLLAFALTIAALWVAYFFSDPRQPAPRAMPSVLAPVDGRFAVHCGLPAQTPSRMRARPISLAMNEFNVPVDPFRVSGR